MPTRQGRKREKNENNCARRTCRRMVTLPAASTATHNRRNGRLWRRSMGKKLAPKSLPIWQSGWTGRARWPPCATASSATERPCGWHSSRRRMGWARAVAITSQRTIDWLW